MMGPTSQKPQHQNQNPAREVLLVQGIADKELPKNVPRILWSKEYIRKLKAHIITRSIIALIKNQITLNSHQSFSPTRKGGRRVCG